MSTAEELKQTAVEEPVRNEKLISNFIKNIEFRREPRRSRRRSSRRRVTASNEKRELR